MAEEEDIVLEDFAEPYATQLGFLDKASNTLFHDPVSCFRACVCMLVTNASKDCDNWDGGKVGGRPVGSIANAKLVGVKIRRHG
jgi:hypothetical protein